MPYSTDKKMVVMATAQALTGSYVVSTGKAYLEVYAEDIVRFDVIYVTGASATATVCSYKIETSNDDGVTWFQERIKEESAGVITPTEVEQTFGGGTGSTTYKDTTILQNTARRIRISVKETGAGNAGSVTINATMFAGVALGGGSPGGGGGAAGAVSISDGDDEALGAKADAAASSDIGIFSLIALFKRGLQGITTLIAKDYATQTTLAGVATEATLDTRTGSLTETAPATDTASSGLNGRLQRIAQRITSMIALLPAALGAGGGLKVDGSGTSLPVTASAGTDLNTSALALESGGNLAAAASSLALLDDTVAATAAAAPSKAVLLGGITSGNLVGVALSASGSMLVGTVTPGTGAGNLGKAIDSPVGSTDTGLAALVKRKDSLATLTPADGDYTTPQVDSQGALWVRQSSTPSTQFNKTNITTATTTTPKSGAGIFGGLVINKAVATSTITIYDNTAASGTLIGTITFGATISGEPIPLPFNASVTSGITIVTSGAVDLTVLYN